MAQRYPQDFDGIFSRVPVINWTGLQHAGTAQRPGHDGRWLDPAGAGEAGARRGARAPAMRPTAWPTASCRTRWAAGSASTSTRCAARGAPRRRLPERRAGARGADTALAAIASTFELANGVREYPGRGLSGENHAVVRPHRRLDAPGGSAARRRRCRRQPANGIAWVYGSRRDPVLLRARTRTPTCAATSPATMLRACARCRR